jgi:hypothetical protein
LEQYLRDKVRVSTQGEWLQPKLDSIGLDLVEISDASPAPTLVSSLNFKAPAPINDFLMQCRLLDEADERHNNFAKFNINGYVRPFMFTPSNTFRHGNPKDPAAAGQDSLWHTAASFGTHGIEHIFAGYDHLLFLIGLLLIATTLGTTVKIVTAFTIGHSISLALAALHVVAVPRGLLESLIALTIVYVGVENLFSWFPLKRWILSFSFGLVHGLAFAETLQLLELPLGQMLVALSSFNIGVEIAQVTVVLICLPFIFGLAKTSWRVQTIKALSLLIVLFGTGWFIDRALPGVLN